MKFNWGWGVLFICIGFVLFMSGLVYRASQEKVEFVTDHYYEKELVFQQQIDQQKNLSNLDQPLEIKFLGNLSVVEIVYPGPAEENVSGEITFYKPDDATLDFRLSAAADKWHKQYVRTDKMKPGWWKIKLDWESGGHSYYHEEKILVE